MHRLSGSFLLGTRCQERMEITRSIGELTLSTHKIFNDKLWIGIDTAERIKMVEINILPQKGTKSVVRRQQFNQEYGIPLFPVFCVDELSELPEGTYFVSVATHTESDRFFNMVLEAEKVDNWI